MISPCSRIVGLYWPSSSLLSAAVTSRDCYQCLSTHSFQDCAAKQYRVTCLSSQHCVKASAKRTSGIRDEGYVKGCAATCSASGVPICNEPNVQCKVSCCSSDYCNGASGPTVNRILLIATFTASFMYLFGCQFHKNTNRPNFVKITTLKCYKSSY